jgi:hypothetical protein
MYEPLIIKFCAGITSDDVVVLLTNQDYYLNSHPHLHIVCYL